MKLGEKIKKYRKRAGISQMDLEYAIKASPGSISRIESGRVNPTKETLIDISNFLKINDFDLVDLFGVELTSSQKILKIINTISRQNDFDSVVKTLVDELYDEFKLHTGLFVVEENQIRGKYNGSHFLSEKSMKMMGLKTFEDINLSLDELENFLVKTVVEKKIFETKDIVDFGVGIAPKKVLWIVGKLINFDKGLSIPIMDPVDQKVSGILFLVDTNNTQIEKEVELLQGLANQVGIIKKNYENLEKIKNEIRRED